MLITKRPDVETDRAHNKRGQRMPRYTSMKTQVATIQNKFVAVSNSAGFMRLVMNPFNGALGYYADATHTDTVLGAYTDKTYGLSSYGMVCKRVNSATMVIENTTPIQNQSGSLRAYETYIGPAVATYDAYEDSNGLTLKQQVTNAVSWHAGDIAELLLWDSSVGNVSNTHSIGFILRGGATQSFLVTYSVTYEYTSASNTDSNPYAAAPRGHPAPIVLPSNEQKKKKKRRRTPSSESQYRMKITESNRQSIGGRIDTTKSGRTRPLPVKRKPRATKTDVL